MVILAAVCPDSPTRFRKDRGGDGGAWPRAESENPLTRIWHPAAKILVFQQDGKVMIAVSLDMGY